MAPLRQLGAALAQRQPDALSPLVLAVLVRNLVDNAVRYSPLHAQVQVSVSRHAGQVVLRVEDSGPGLDAAQQARLGERFFRVPGQVESGSGVGWRLKYAARALKHYQNNSG